MFHLNIEEEFLTYHTLEEIFEMNDLTELDVLRILIQYGHIEIPSYVGYQLPEEESDTNDE